MTRDEALNILAVSEGTSTEEIIKKFAELQNDYQLRLTNAPTPNLKKLYQKNIAELNEAKAMLLGGAAAPATDLPSAEPSFQKTTTSSFSQSKPNPTPSDNSVKSSSDKKPAEKSESGNKWQMIGISLGVVLLAVIIFAVVDMNRRSSEYEAQSFELESLKTEFESSEALLDQYKTIFENGKFKVKNKGSQAFKVEWIIVNYLDENNEIQKYFEFTNKTIRPGGAESFSKVEGAETLWDGSVVFFVCSIKNGDTQSFQSGVWSNESEDGVLNWNWDK